MSLPGTDERERGEDEAHGNSGNRGNKNKTRREEEERGAVSHWAKKGDGWFATATSTGTNSNAGLVVPEHARVGDTRDESHA